MLVHVLVTCLDKNHFRGLIQFGERVIKACSRGGQKTKTAEKPMVGDMDLGILDPIFESIRIVG